MPHFYWKIDRHLERKGNPNAHQLALGAGLSYPVATRIIERREMTRLDSDTLTKLAVYFGLKPERALSLVEVR
jgi:hypothetical protein